MVFKFLQVLWRRISDICTASDILDLFGWRQWVVAMIGAICSALSGYILGAPGWLIFSLAMGGLLIVLTGILVWQNWRGTHSPNEEPEFISLKDAARKFYESARTGQIPNAMGSENMSRMADDFTISAGSPEDILDWWATHAKKHLKIYGKRPPSSLLQEIPAQEVRSFGVTEGATKLENPWNKKAFYTDLWIKSEEFEHQLAFEEGAHSESQ